jgi:hypothetical protein
MPTRTPVTAKSHASQGALVNSSSALYSSSYRFFWSRFLAKLAKSSSTSLQVRAHAYTGMHMSGEGGLGQEREEEEKTKTDMFKHQL